MKSLSEELSMRLIAFIAAIAALAGCASVEEQAANRCASYGMPGNPQCLMLESHTIRAEQMAIAQTYVQQMQFQQALQAAQQPAPPQSIFFYGR